MRYLIATIDGSGNFRNNKGIGIDFFNYGNEIAALFAWYHDNENGLFFFYGSIYKCNVIRNNSKSDMFCLCCYFER